MPRSSRPCGSASPGSRWWWSRAERCRWRPCSPARSGRTGGGRRSAGRAATSTPPAARPCSTRCRGRRPARSRTAPGGARPATPPARPPGGGAGAGGGAEGGAGGGARGGGHILVIGHYDPVWEAGWLASHPFEMRGLVATGPGVLDMKGAIVALELAFELLAGSGRALAQPVQVVLVGDEEVSSPNGRTAVMAAAAGAAAALRLGAPPPSRGATT